MVGGGGGGGGDGGRGVTEIGEGTDAAVETVVVQSIRHQSEIPHEVKEGGRRTPPPPASSSSDERPRCAPEKPKATPLPSREPDKNPQGIPAS